jgi:curved DNA-binding protein CbpA
VLNPYQALGITPATSEAETRTKYLGLIREFTPEQHPERFAEIRQAFELVGTLSARADYHLYGFTRSVTLDDVIKELKCRTPVRVKLDQLSSITQPK